MTNTIAYNYAKLPNLVFGFHGCRQETFENVLYKHEPLAQSQNRYDWLLRDLDCAVIECVHTLNRLNNFPAYDSVRGIFTEGKASFPGSGFKEKTHVQLCIINPNCIKGYFNPIETDSEYPLP